MLISISLGKFNSKLNLLAFHLLIAGIFTTTFFSIVTIENFRPPVNLAFFGAQIIGLIGILLMHYLSVQPKSS